MDDAISDNAASARNPPVFNVPVLVDEPAIDAARNEATAKEGNYTQE